MVFCWAVLTAIPSWLLVDVHHGWFGSLNASMVCIVMPKSLWKCASMVAR